MIFTQKDMAQATTSFESRFRLAYLSVDFNPTIVFACRSKALNGSTNEDNMNALRMHIAA